MPTTTRSFSRRVLLSQLAVVVVILVLVTAVFAWMGARNVADVTETKALATARALASSPEVRRGATRASAEHTDPPAQTITDPLKAIAQDVRTKSGIDFVVITDDRGIRLTHPNQSLVGHRVSTSPDEALAGHENVTHEAGTLGETVRAKVPIYSSTDGTSVVGEVSVGITTSVVDRNQRREFLALGSVAVLALTLGVVASLMLGRRLRRETLGIGPEELAEMARDQGAVLRGLDDGVLGFNATGELTLTNAVAEGMLTGAPALVAGTADEPADVVVEESLRPIAEVPDVIRSLIAEVPDGGSLQRRVSIGDRILLATAVRVTRDGVAVGGVVTLRDETQMLTMARQLESVTTMAKALRSQRHEFANRLHTVLGLVDTGSTDEAHDYLSTILRTGPVATLVEGVEHVSDPYLRALLEAKGTLAAEAGVALSVTPDSLVLGRVVEPEDVTLILGNLIDNAVRAAVEGRSLHGTEARVEVEILGAGDDLHAVISDTGTGVETGDEERIFDDGYSRAGDSDTAGPAGPTDSTGWPDSAGWTGSTAGSGSGGAGAAAARSGPSAVDHTPGGPEHGLGIGLAVSRRIAARHGGEVWLVAAEDPDLGGASFGMRLPGVLGAEAADDDTDGPDEDEETR